MNSNPVTFKEIIELTKDNILDDTLFARLFYYRDDMDEFEFLNLKQALFEKAGELKKLTACREKFQLFARETDRLNREKQEERQSRNKELERSHLPIWIDENDKINEVDFINEFANLYDDEQKYFCINGNMYDYNGIIEDDKIKKIIQEKISPYIKRRIADTTSQLLRALKTACTIDKPPLDDTKIHVTNGYYSLTDGRFHNEFMFTTNRLNVWYNHEYKEPKLWLKYLTELLEIDDIFTLQEYLGYCMIPNKKAQKALYIHGNGEEGKSIIKSIVNAMFGKSYAMINLKDLLEGSFALATLDNKLVVVDDDAPSSALKDSSRLKTLVTNNEPMQVNPKGKPAYDTVIYSRLLVLSNAPIQALHDNSDGFFRRQIIIKTKDKPADRVDDKLLTDKILKELDDIFLWCLDGLKRLIYMGYKFTISESSKERLEELKEESFNVFKFIKNETFIKFTGDMNDKISTQELYRHYQQWCDFNEEKSISFRTVSVYFNNNTDKHGIKKDGNIIVQGKRCRGFRGIKIFQLK